MSVVVAVLLVIAVAGAALSTVGVLLAPDAFDRLHHLGPVTVISGPALALAALLSVGPGLVAARVAVVVAIVAASSPVLVHAAARAGVTRGDADRLRGVDVEVDGP